MQKKTLRLILGDQLNYNHSWYNTIEPQVCYVLMEVRQETDYAKHHIQKVTGFFAAMYNFVEYLQKKGHQVIHYKINDPANQQDIGKNCLALIEAQSFQHFEYQLPDEYRLDAYLKTFVSSLKISSACSDTEHFYTTRSELGELFKGKKTYLMETFYRQMRRLHNVLMEGKNPEGGQWNFDSDNRNPYKGADVVPPPFLFKHNYKSIEKEIKKAGIQTIGTMEADAFFWPTSREQSLQLMRYFHQHFLPLFGKYQDAMHTKYWSLYHARLSFSLNTKMISPTEVVNAAIATWRANSPTISLAQIEGYVRQILGWREYMRGIYWAQMPNYKTLNFFNHERALPTWYWNGNTKMNCLKHAIQQSLTQAYAHHIQRLMVTGNFALLAGIHPNAVDEWYLGIYIDAIEWVEITNTRGMSQYADGGIVGSKPYVSGSGYISKMSNYCQTCYYDKTKKTGERACPFNSLYWHFYERHRTLLAKNPRIGMMYRILDKMEPAEKAAVLEQAEQYLEHINEL